MEPYKAFAELQDNETDGDDYRIRVRYGRSGLAVMAIHGGGIEPGTTEIAEAVAGEGHSFYTFSGLKPSGNAKLHISSRTFDEPLGIKLAEQVRVVVTVHGCKDEKEMTFLGGRHLQLKHEILNALTEAGFPATASRRFPGVNPKNICNKGQSGLGVQLEISMGMRMRFFDDISRLHRKRATPCFLSYVHALRKALQHETQYANRSSAALSSVENDLSWDLTNRWTRAGIQNRLKTGIDQK